MQHLPIKTKMYVSVGAIVVILSAIIAFSVYKILLSTEIFMEYRATALGTVQSNAIGEDVLQARLMAFKYRSTGDPAVAEEVLGNVREIIDAGAEARQIFEQYPEFVQVVDDVIQAAA